MRKYSMIIALLFGMQLCVFAQESEKQPRELTPGMKLELKMIQERLKLKNGRFVRTRYDYIRTSEEDPESGESVRYKIEFREEKLRRETPDHVAYGRSYPKIELLTPTEYASAIWDGPKLLIKLNEKLTLTQRKEAYEESQRIRFSARQNGFGGGETQADTLYLESSVWLPDHLGIHLSKRKVRKLSIGEHLSVPEDYLQDWNRTNEVISDELLNDIPVKHVSYKLPNGKHVEYWLALDQGNTLQKVVEHISSHQMGKPVQKVETYEYFWKQSPEGIWYPERATYVVQDGNVILEDLEAVVSEVDFETPVAESRFTFEADKAAADSFMEITENVHYTEEGVKTDQEFREYLIRKGGAPPSNNYQWLTLVRNAVLIALIGLLVSVVVLQKRRKTMTGKL